MCAISEFLVLFELCNVLGRSALDLDLDTGFITNGGDSLGALALAAACRTHGIELTRKKILRDETLRDIISTTPRLADAEPTHVRSYLLSKHEPGGEPPLSTASRTTSGSASSPADPGSGSPGSYSTDASDLASQGRLADASAPPLTEMQLHFIRGSLRQPGANVIVHSELYEAKHIQTLKESWRQVIETEPIFNHEFPVYPAMKFGPTGFHWRDATAKKSDVEDIETSDIASFFRVTPSKGSDELCWITWSVHHSLIDGYSASILFDKVLRLANGESALPPGPSFWQFSRQLDSFRQDNMQLGVDYWAAKQKRLSLAHHELGIPPARADRDADAQEHAGSGTVSLDVADISDKIDARARSIRITPATVYNAAWALTLARFSDGDVVSFGVVLCGRSQDIPGASHVIGPALNTLPLAIDVSRGMTGEEFLRDVFDQLVELEGYQWTTPESGFTRSFETALSIQVGVPDPSDRRIRPLERVTRQEHEIPLGITVDCRGRVSFEYHVSRFSRRNIQRLSETYRRALELLIDPTRSVDDILSHILPDSHVAMLQKFSNCRPSTLRSNTKEDLVTLFEKQVRDHPDNVAVEKGCEQMSYRRLDDAASRVATRLGCHVKPGDVVCVYSDRSILWLCAILGILKAGGVYCSLDPTAPQEVRDRIFDLSGARALLTAKTCQLRIVPESCPVSFTVQSTVDRGDLEPAEHRRAAKPHSPAYVCFTSGSTGAPKGVLCSHAGLVAFQSALDVRLFSAPGRRVAHVMSVAFDGSIHEIFSALTHGGTLVLPSGADPFGHLRSVDSAILTPSLARLLDPDEFDMLKWVYLVGEPVPQAVCDRWASSKQLYNMYGPTEGTCGATIKRLLPGQPVNVGRPNPTTRVYILNSDRSPTPPGAVGEIHLAGVQVAGGYLGLPRDTADRFLPDTVWPLEADDRMYVTGDRGYWTEDGEVVLLGRRDRQIKLMGYRLDLGDLEIRIARACPSLHAVAVTHSAGRLVSIVQPSSVDVGGLREELGRALPPYAVPHTIVAVDQIPVTRAGKVDYAALLEVAAGARVSRVQQQQQQPPAGLSSPTQVAVARAFRLALQLPDHVEMTASTSFAELGGHSLHQLELMRHTSSVFGVRLSLRTVLGSDTVADLADAIDCHVGSSPSPPAAVDQRPRVSQEDATPIEVEWMKKYETPSGSSSFNVCLASFFDATVVDRKRLIEAWNAVLARHQLLACRYAYSGTTGEVIRVSTDRVPRVQTPPSLDLWSEVNRPFALEDEQPVRAFVTDDNQLVVVLSHIVADYTSLGILVREASAAYNGMLPDTAPRSYSLADAWYTSPGEEVLSFWRAYLGGCPENPGPFGRDVKRLDYSGTSTLATIGADVFQRVCQFSRQEKVSLQQIAVACVALCLDNRSDSTTDMLIGVPNINRHTAEDLDTFGLFLEPLTVRIRYDAHSEETSFMESVKKSCQLALAHVMPWHQLLRHMQIEPDYPNHPLFDVMVTMHDFRFANHQDMGIPGVEPCLTWSEGAKFKLLCEFTALPSGKLLLRLEYDANVVPAPEVARIQRAMGLVIGAISSGDGYASIKTKVAEALNPCDTLHGGSLQTTQVPFGACLRDI